MPRWIIPWTKSYTQKYDIRGWSTSEHTIGRSQFLSAASIGLQYMGAGKVYRALEGKWGKWWNWWRVMQAKRGAALNHQHRLELFPWFPGRGGFSLCRPPLQSLLAAWHFLALCIQDSVNSQWCQIDEVSNLCLLSKWVPLASSINVNHWALCSRLCLRMLICNFLANDDDPCADSCCWDHLQIAQWFEYSVF